MSTETSKQKRPWWQRGPITALWLALLLIALAHAKPLIDSGLATEETRAALRAFGIHFTILTGVISIFFWLGTIPHAGNRGRLRTPVIAGIDPAALSSQPTSPENRNSWSHLDGYKVASGVGFVLGATAVGFSFATNAIIDGRVTILELWFATFIFLVVLWLTLTLWAANELRREESLERVSWSLPTGEGAGLFVLPLIFGSLIAGAELLPESLAYLWSRPPALLRNFARRSAAA